MITRSMLLKGLPVCIVAAITTPSPAGAATFRASAPTAGDQKPLQPRPGSYSGKDVNDDSLAFFVSPGGRSIANVAVPSITFGCTPTAPLAEASYAEGSINHPLTIAHVTVKRNGSFIAKASESGILRDVPAKFTYFFTGRLGAAGAGGQRAAAGSLRENIVFADKTGTAHQCTSNNRSWTAATSGPAPPRSLVAVGGYSGADADNDSLAFSVSSGGRSIANVAVPSITFSCAPTAPLSEASYAEGSINHPLAIPHVTVKQNGSFSATSSETGVLRDVPARFTYVFSGSFEGVNASGTRIAAGLLREDIVFTDKNGTAHRCTSNNRPWTAARSS